jgi:integrase
LSSPRNTIAKGTDRPRRSIASATLRRLLSCGDLPVTQLGPKALKRVREEFIREDLARVTVNNNVARIKRMVRWGVENELVPVAVHQALMTVAGLRKGRSTARESKPVPPVEDAVVDATLPFLSAPVQAMVRLQRLTGCRPGEICLVRPGDVDRSAEVWCYRPATHKLEHRDLERRIYLGPRASRYWPPG